MAHSYNSIHTYACLGWVHGSDGVDSVDHALLLEQGSASSTRLLLRSLLSHQQSQQIIACQVLSLKTGSGKRCSRREPSAPLDVPAFPHSSIGGILAASSGELFSEWPEKTAGESDHLALLLCPIARRRTLCRSSFRNCSGRAKAAR